MPPALRKGHPPRLSSYDYSAPGAYFVTINTHGRANLFGKVIDGKMRLNNWGMIVQEEWWRTPALRPEVSLDQFVLMPNHLHGIVIINWSHSYLAPASETDLGARLTRLPRTLGSIIAGFKSASTKRIRLLSERTELRIWQSRFYEHVIRTEQSLRQIRQYIVDNPARWEARQQG